MSIARTGAILGELALTREPGDTPKLYQHGVQASSFCEVRRIDWQALQGAFGTPDGDEQRSALKKAMKEDRVNRRRETVQLGKMAATAVRNHDKANLLTKGPKAISEPFKPTRHQRLMHAQGIPQNGKVESPRSGKSQSVIVKRDTDCSESAEIGASSLSANVFRKQSPVPQTTQGDDVAEEVLAAVPCSPNVEEGKPSKELDNGYVDIDLPSESHKGWHQVTAPDGLVVRNGPELHSEVLHTLSYGSVIEAFDRKTNIEGVTQLKLQAGGWVSEPSKKKQTLSGAEEESFLKPVEAPELQKRLWYRVKGMDLPVHKGLEHSHDIDDVVGILQAGEVFEVTERKRNDAGQMCFFVEHLNGWASEWPSSPDGGDDVASGNRLAVQLLPQVGEGVFWYQVLVAEGLPVRVQKEPPSSKGHGGERPVRFMKRGETFFCTLRALCNNGSVALHVGDGWVSERRPPGKGLGCLLVKPVDAPASIGYFGYQVQHPEGIVVHEGLKLKTPKLRSLPCGGIFISTARVQMGASMRLFMGDGWTSERTVTPDGGTGKALVVPIDDCLATWASKSTQLSWFEVISQSGAPIFQEINNLKTPPPTLNEDMPKETLPCGAVVAVDSIRRDKESGRLWMHVITLGSCGMDGSGGWLPNRAVEGEAAGALLVQRVDAPEGEIPGWYISHDALKVYDSLKLPSDVIRTLPACMPFYVHERKSSGDNMRLFVGDGWVTERAITSDGSKGGLLAEMTTAPTGKVSKPRYRLRRMLEQRWAESKGQPRRRKKELEAAFALREDTPEEAKQKAQEENAADLCHAQDEEQYPTDTLQLAYITYNSGSPRPASAPRALASAETHREAAEFVHKQLAHELARLEYKERLAMPGFRDCAIDLVMPGTNRNSTPRAELVPRPPSSHGRRTPRVTGGRPVSQGAGSRPQSRPQSRNAAHPPRPTSRVSDRPGGPTIVEQCYQS